MPGLQGSGYPITGTGGGGTGTVVAWEAVVDPGATNDSADTAGIGQEFGVADLWFNSVSGVLWSCEDDSVGAAVWEKFVQSDVAPTDNDIARFDGASGGKVQPSGWQIDDLANLRTAVDGTGNIGVSATTFRPANVWATTSVRVVNSYLTPTGMGVDGPLALVVTPTEAAGAVLRNTTAATAVAMVQVSPAIYQIGQGWDATGVATAEVAWRTYGVPIAGNPPMGQHRWDFSVGGGAYSNRMEITSWGLF
ncbi:MAG TPA: hypothetical protein VMW24_06560, partial [Sedimentisphaerales bacterium]|nr:hypothetical protein [Sedimentisphaerales bacterium]